MSNQQKKNNPLFIAFFVLLAATCLYYALVLVFGRNRPLKQSPTS